TGEGGDELLGGFVRYARARRLAALPAPLRRVAGAGLRTVPVRVWDTVLRRAARRGRESADRAIDPGRASAALSGHRLHALSALLAEPDDALRYRDLASVAVETGALVLGRGPGADASEAERGRRRWSELDGLDPTGRMMLLDQLGYLPDDILTKVDRAAMSVALETRIPLLDHRVVALAWRLPPAVRTRGGTAKWPLRAIAEEHVPAALLDRPKAGFAVPLAAWLRGPLRAWAEDLLDADALRRQGLLDAAGVHRLWREHLTGRRERHNELWPVLVLQAWLSRRTSPAATEAPRPTP
ncbi:MAG: asparagine synthase-related protein, partial [Nitriliruptoraceae bacterium]